MKLFSVGTRSNVKGKYKRFYYQEDGCFIGSNIEKCEEFIRKNPDYYGDEKIVWYWCICITYLNFDLHNSDNDEYRKNYGLYKKYTKEGIEILDI